MNLLKVASILTLGLASSGCVIAINAHDEDRDRQAESRQISDFTKLDIKGSVRLDVQVGREPSLMIMGDSRSVPGTQTRVVNGTLLIDRNSSKGNRPRIRITVPHLDGLKASDSIEARITGLDSDQWQLDTEGRGDVYLTGTCRNASYKTAGRTDIHADGFTCQNVNITHEGRGEVEVYATDLVNVRLLGRGDVVVSGRASIGDRDLSGTGKLVIN